MRGPRIPPEQRAATQQANQLRWRDIYRTGRLDEITDEGDDPFPMTQHGENRLRFNLGDGCVHKPARKARS